MKAIGLKIRLVRESRNMTQEDLAASIGISATHISVIERGKKIPKIDTFVSIANALEVSADFLLSDVVVHSTSSYACVLSDKLSMLTPDLQMRILRAIDAFIK